MQLKDAVQQNDRAAFEVAISGHLGQSDELNYALCYVYLNPNAEDSSYYLQRLFEVGATSYSNGIQRAILFGNLELAKYIASLSPHNGVSGAGSAGASGVPSIWTDKYIMWAACRGYENNDPPLTRRARREIIDFIISMGNTNWDHGYYGAYQYELDLAVEMLTRRSRSKREVSPLYMTEDTLQKLIEHGLCLTVAKEFDNFELLNAIDAFRADVFIKVTHYVLPELAKIVCHQYSTN